MFIGGGRALTHSHIMLGTNEKVTSGGRVNELNDTALEEQLQLVATLDDESKEWKDKMKHFNDRSNEMLDGYRRDDGHNLSHLASKLNTQWTKFNDSLRIRRAVLEAAQRSRQDFHSALGQFQQWLYAQSSDLARLERDTDNTARLKDTSRRRDWMAEEKEARMEIEAHQSVMDSIRQMGRKLVEEQEDGREKQQLRERLDGAESEWDRMINNSRIVRERLENAQEECERLTQGLSDLLFWTDQQLKTIANAQPVAGDLGGVQKQSEVIKTIEKTVEAREGQVQDCIQLAHSYLMQHDLRPTMHTPAMCVHPEQIDDGTLASTEAEREERRVGVQILADSDKLKSSWALLKQQVQAWSKVVITAHKDMQELDKCIAESLLAIGSMEDEIQSLPLVESLRLEELKDARAENADLKQRVHEISTRIDDVNDCAGQLAAKNIGLSQQLSAQIQAINQRYEKLKRDVGCRGAALERAFNDFGPSSEHFLVDSVEPPWQRSISHVTHLPYYIDHNTETTQWDHPVMVDILEQLATFNQVKFSAYRTAMKLRALQKRLCLDLIELVELDESLERLDKDYTNITEDRLRVEDAIMCLVPLFELANERFPHLLKNVPMAVDLAMNLLLNIYDPCRDGRLRVLSFKVALVVMYLFHLISTNEGVDHKRLALLFYDLIYIPKFLGEVAAFGGSNIEPSVRSCFEHSKFPPHINVEDFLDWLKKEPQSIVWLPVMHRLASSEFAKHQAKCNACKMFPIVGMRYRCLRCFNFDICQNCFFSQRTAKNHKLTHPMQEYCLPTNPKDDMRDFTAMVRNKVRRARSKIGYLPVEQVEEGLPFEQTDITPQNPASETIHQRMHLFAQRLERRQLEAQTDRVDDESHDVTGEQEEAPTNGVPQTNGWHERQKSDGAPPMGRADPGVKSPSQLAKQVDQMRKEELDQLLQKLQFENMELKRAMDERKRTHTAGYSSPVKSTPNLQSPDYPNGHTQNQVYPGSLRGYPSQQHPLYSYQAMYASNQAMSPHMGSRAMSSGPAASMASLGQQPPPVPRHGHPSYGRSVPSLLRSPPPAMGYQRNVGKNMSAMTLGAAGPNTTDLDDFEDQQVLIEAKNLRLHQQRLEQRSKVLEDQNRQLQQQLERLNRMVEKQKSTTTLNGHMNGDRVPPPMPPSSWTLPGRSLLPIPSSGGGGITSSSADEDDELAMFLGPVGPSSQSAGGGGLHATEVRRNRMENLKGAAEELNRAMESFVVSVVVSETGSGLDDEDGAGLEQNGLEHNHIANGGDGMSAT
ncbi:EF hand domain-containing protein [Ditylenchus destructor]|nr:EF hand domain-containing protein [Ditylenchus destructor]